MTNDKTFHLLVRFSSSFTFYSEVVTVDTAIHKIGHLHVFSNHLDKNDYRNNIFVAYEEGKKMALHVPFCSALTLYPLLFRLVRFVIISHSHTE